MNFLTQIFFSLHLEWGRAYQFGNFHEKEAEEAEFWQSLINRKCFKDSFKQKVNLTIMTKHIFVAKMVNSSGISPMFVKLNTGKFSI